jgi:FkbM family methyltransferase
MINKTNQLPVKAKIRFLLRKITPGIVRYHPIIDWLYQKVHLRLNRYLKEEEHVFKQAWAWCSDHPPSLVYDIGANEGYTTQFFLKMKAKRIIAFEPDPQAFKILSHRFATCEKVRLIPVALGDKSGSFPFYQVSPNSGFNTFVYDWYLKYKHPHSKIMMATMMPITDIFRQYGLPDLIKIDVEGMEWEIIKSITQDIPFLCFEANLPLFATNTRSILRYLKTLLPKHLILYSSNHTLSLPISLTEALQLLEQPISGCIDFFFIRKRFPNPSPTEQCYNSETNE